MRRSLHASWNRNPLMPTCKHPTASPRQLLQYVLRTTCCCILLASITPQASAQTQRLELGRRLKRFEIAWEQASPKQRSESIKPLKQAVNSFFSLQLSQAGQQLDNAWFAVRSTDPPSQTEKTAIAHSLSALPLCAVPETAELRLHLTPFYPLESTLPENTLLQLVLKNRSSETLAEFQCPASTASAGTTWNTGPLPAGDHHIEATLHAENQTIRLPGISISRIPELPQRLEVLKQVAETLRQQALSASPAPDLPPATLAAAATARSEVALLTAASEGRSTEADFPLQDRLLIAEQLAASPRNAAEIIARHKSPQDLWLTLAKGRKSAPVRLRLPADATARPKLPVLFVFHGAGGSENMFFETYGAGRTISEASKRGWLVVAPGQGLLGLSLSVADMLDNLEHFTTIDRSQVMLLGHSMGAAQVMRQMQQDPACARAAAALGGGGRMTTTAAATLTPVRWYVAAGTEDFGRAGAMQLHRSLSNAGVTSEYHDFPNVEHLVIVQAATTDVFRFFDQSLTDADSAR
jgi:predicted esterase